MVGVIWYRFVRYSGTDWSATLVPIRPLLWYRLERCAGTDSSATVVPIRRYYHLDESVRLTNRNSPIVRCVRCCNRTQTACPQYKCGYNQASQCQK